MGHIDFKTLVVGDVHNEFGYLNSLINKKQPDLVLACGDFGFWPNTNLLPLSYIKPQNSTIRWCDGNHENHWELKKRTKNELEPSIIYQPRGSTFTLPDGRTVMFFGGAYSIDKNYRTIGIDWFPEETINQKDLLNLPEMHIDIFITHTCPIELVPILTAGSWRDYEPSNHALSILWTMYNPSLWYLGHWHCYKEIKMRATKFYVLSAPGFGDRWWTWL